MNDIYFLQVRPPIEQLFVGEGLFTAPDTMDDQYQRYTLRSWWVFLQANKDKKYKIRCQLYERALAHIPNCYKLWFNYLKESLQNLQREKSFLSEKYEEINNLFERALIYMHKMPNIWLLYSDFLASQGLLTKTREVYDRILMSLPVTQHKRIWKKYCDWTISSDSIKTAKHVYERYLKVNPDSKEDYLDFLISKAQWDRASQILVDILNDEGYSSHQGKSKYDFLNQLCDILSQHPNQVKSIDCAAIMTFGIKKYTDEVGTMWIRLADYHIKMGLFEKARDVFEDALGTVQAVRDFSQVFNAYVKFEESLLSMLQGNEDGGDSDDDEDLDDCELAKKLDKILGLNTLESNNQHQDEIELKLHRLENLLERRQILLNSCLLRQNKYNVNEWLNRVKYYKDDERMIIKTFKEAIETIDPLKAEIGKLSDIWYIIIVFQLNYLTQHHRVQYGNFYRKKGDWKTANLIYYEGSQVNYKNTEEYVNLWALWIEALIEDGYPEDALIVIKQPLFRKNQNQKIQDKSIESLQHSLELWQLYLDLEREFGTFQTLRSAYKRMLELKVVTPFLIMTYAQLLEDNAYYEDSFKVYEAGVQLFTWPSLYELWILYLTKFIERYRGQKVERVRNIFETVLETVPVEKCKIFYIMYGDFEEQYGLLNHAIEIYDRMVFNVEYKDKMQAYNIYIAKVGTYLGITKTRAVFESAIENLKENEVIQMGQRLAQLERKFGEIDRARSIYMHIAQFNDPRFDDFELWKTWENFELYHGNEDTYKDLKRVSKSVISKFNLLPPDPQKIKERVEKGQI